MMAEASGGVLVTGTPRSGTTWVGKMLDLSSRLAYIHEPFNADSRVPGSCAAQWEHWFPYVCEENRQRWEIDLVNTLSLGFDHRSARQSLTAITDPAQKSERLRLCQDYIRSMRRARRKQAKPLVKDPIALLSANWLAERFKLQVIVMIRHPAAFVHGFVRLGWRFWFDNFRHQPLLMRDLYGDFLSEMDRTQSSDTPFSPIREAALLWKMLNHRVDHYRRIHPDWLFIKHEELAKNPLTGFADIYAALGLDFSERTAARIADFCGRHNPAIPADHSDVRRHSQGLLNQWQDSLDANDIQLIRSIVEPVSGRFYADDSWP